MSAEPAIERILAFDFGERRIGLASGNRLSATASPLGVIACRDGDPDWNEIDRQVADWAPDALIVGQPPRGNERLLQRIENFVQSLGNRYKLRVYLVDESMSSRTAQSLLAARRRDGTRSKRVKRGDIDKLAACLIAQRWLDGPEADSDA